MRTNVFKKERGRYTIHADSPLLPIYRFYLDMGGEYHRQLDRCHFLKAVLFMAPWYFLTRKKVVRDLTIPDIAIPIVFGLYIISMVVILFIVSPQNTLVLGAALVLIYRLRNPISTILEKMSNWYLSNKNYTFLTLKLLATFGVLFTASSYFYGLNLTWAVFLLIIKVIGFCVACLAALFGGAFLYVEASDRYKTRKRKARQLKQEASWASGDGSGLPAEPEVESDTILRLIWDHLKTIKNLYFCPLIDIPEGAIVPRDVSYS